MKAIICPISTEKIDSNVSRLTIFLNVLLMAIYLISLHPVYIVIVAFDYAVRAINRQEYSPLRMIAYILVRWFKVSPKPVNKAQKIFASRLGMLCSIASGILYFTGNITASVVIATMLMVLAFMDSVLNFCLGCIIYNYLVFPFYKNR